MSVEDMKEYARRCAVEPELRARAKAIGFADPDGHIEHGKSLGLEFTMDDAVAFRSQVTGTEEDMAELAEEDLEMVAGGAISATTIVVGLAVGAAAGAGAAVAVGGAAVGVAAAAGGGW